MRRQQLVHVAATWARVGRGDAFAALSDAGFVGGWALGSMGLKPADEAGVFTGASIFDGARVRVRIVPDAALGLIDFHVGTDTLSPRISIRVTDGPAIGGQPGECLIVMTALRAPGTGQESWDRTCACHEAEILMIRAHLERLA